jgi:hypothetical protein
MSFPTTLHLTWPSFFTRLASRLSVVNVHLLSLPSLACLHAEPSVRTCVRDSAARLRVLTQA